MFNVILLLPNVCHYNLFADVIFGQKIFNLRIFFISYQLLSFVNCKHLIKRFHLSVYMYVVYPLEPNDANLFACTFFFVSRSLYFIINRFVLTSERNLT